MDKNNVNNNFFISFLFIDTSIYKFEIHNYHQINNLILGRCRVNQLSIRCR